jgi:sulfur-carrier protein adenylyltransferase/sulfurtransferase
MSVQQISPQIAQVRLSAGVQLIDVRSRAEYAAGAAQGAESIPQAELLAALQHQPRERALMLICQSGVRSLAAAQALQRAGFSDVSSVQGGSNAWAQAGLPLDRPFAERYQRQMILPGFGASAQQKLLDARVLLIGAGGLGSPAALYLAAAGVGTLGISDGDHVELSNLHRQILHRTSGVGQAKNASAAQALHALNPSVQVNCLPAVDISNVDDYVANYDLVVDGSDNFNTRFLLADASVKHAKPYVYGAVLRFEGQLSVFAPAPGNMKTPCYRCLFAEPPAQAPNCAEAGVLGVLPGVIGTLQACEAIKIITGIAIPLLGELLIYDALGVHFRKIKLMRDPMCKVCAPGAKIEYRDYNTLCASSISYADK